MSRILFLVSSMEGGGAERVAALLCNHWVAQGHEVILMPTFSGRGDCVYPLDGRVRLDFLADHVSSKRRSLLNKIRRYQALRRAMRKLQPDVIVSFLPHVNVAAVLAAWGLQIPVIVSERTYPPARTVGKLLEVTRRVVYPRATAVVMQTELGLAWLNECCPLATGRVIPNPAVYPLPVGTPVVSTAAIVKDTRRVMLAVGRLSREKGFDRLLSAFSDVAKLYPEWDLVILGEGPEREYLESMRQEFRLSDRVFLPGRAGNLGDWYERGELYVMSSHFEGFPNTLIEAMAHGLPVVSFDCKTGPSDIVREGVDGFLIPPPEGAKGLAKAIGCLMGDEQKRFAMGQAAMLVRERFSEVNVVSEWGEVLGLKQGNINA